MDKRVIQVDLIRPKLDTVPNEDIEKQIMQFCTDHDLDMHKDFVHLSDSKEDALKLMDEGPWTCAIFGCVFKNAEQHRKECDEMRAALKERNIRSADMPTFGNVREALFELKLIEEELVNGKSVIKPVANWAEMFSPAAIAG